MKSEILPNIETLLSQVTTDTLILTANKRLANKIADRQHDIQISQQKFAWPSPSILPFSTWLTNIFQNNLAAGIGEAKILLDNFQELLLWEKIIKQSQNFLLLSTSETAYFAQQAWQLLKNWRISLDHPSMQTTAESECWYDWAKQFQDYCQTHQLLDTASLYEHINIIKPPKHIILIGFLEFTPAEQHLFQQLEKQNCQINYYRIENPAKQKHFLGLANVETEIDCMAHWTRHWLENEISATIGCIVPDLQAQRDSLERIFNKVFSNSETKPFNISLGTALLDEPIIHTAFEILRFKTHALSIHEMGYLLRSPFLTGFNEEFSARALLDFKLREIGNVQYDLNQLIQIISHHKKLQSVDCQILIKNLQSLQKISIAQTQFPSEWIKIFSQLLFQLGWPGNRSLNSREYQALTCWNELTNNFRKLDLIYQKINFFESLMLFKPLAALTVFQSKTEKTPIQILGMLEAIDMTFTHLWVMGLDNTHWPTIAKPNPFLPIELQRQYHLPHSSAERELHFSEIMMQQFSTGGDEIIFSYSHHEEDETKQPSALIRNFPEMTLEKLSLSFSNKKTSSNHLECVEDPSVSLSAEEKTKGGTEIFKLQAACPFRAFAILRLQAHPLEKPQKGLSAKERGSIVHRLLELIWKQIRSHNILLNLSETQIKKIIQKNITQALDEQIQFRQIEKTLLVLEKERLQTLLYHWLMLEKNRLPFKVIEQETRYTINLKSLKNIRVRVDRIDQLENQQYVVIDYKTGKTDAQSWFGDRLDEPQLPFYATHSQYSVGAIAFAQVRADEMNFKILGNQNIFPNQKILSENEWQEQLQQWQSILTKLAEQFCAGEATVNPKDSEKTCRYCELSSLCRVTED